MNAYVYLVTFLPTGQKYIGSRKSSSDDLFRKYFTSSKIIKSLIKEHGISEFNYVILKEFEDYKDALAFERLLHIENNVPNNPTYLNKSVAGEKFFTRGPRSEETKEKIRKKLAGRPNPRKGTKGIPCSDNKKKKISDSLKGLIYNKRNTDKNFKTDVWFNKLTTETDITWYNKNTGETFIGNRRALKKYDSSVYVPELGWVISGKSKSHKGWIII